MEDLMVEVITTQSDLMFGEETIEDLLGFYHSVIGDEFILIIEMGR